MKKKFPRNPPHPERVCWGCDKYCPADSMACGNGSERTQHPAELFGEDWFEWEAPVVESPGGEGVSSQAPDEAADLPDS
ncbi:MAG TPA: DUF3079 domain-containing protein [Burkholderiaceae bacterium]|nr:DUF3079 domain-containing protein [Burkholderiaceae bacterium]